MENRFQSPEEIDAFVEALGFMHLEMVQAYAAGDTAWDDISDSIISNIEHLATAAKAGMAKSGR